MEDLQLVPAIRKGDNSAFKMLFNNNYKKLIGYVRTFTNNQEEAADVVQEAFLSLWENRSLLDTERSPKNYLYKIAYNCYMDRYSKRKKEECFFKELKKEALEEHIFNDPQLLERRLERLTVIINNLPPRCKEILKLNKIQGYTQKTIAEDLDISVKTVEAHIRKAYKKIREGFKDDDLFLMVIIKILKL
ncbi:RNA polymerase sigma-70 factor (ECF subfamily) [Gillisia sp. Hel_I_86]|uniref:RNA polymerase sigma factor n=1 Tax=Gillisia sp. Hel_I_86 TaxID=1249981 RepID=UPI00119B70AC|nr:RNA polymerase sigma-70 factor [Gillisia sp. Hel_I_86]TVZ26917.1 RNA polymerase sigma-70 factor (ECF subfamily) [Gillisia sp. Hel_I_86]